MDLKYSKIVNRELKKASMLLYGELGESSGMVNGHYFADELNWLSKNYDEITIRINSDGGYISHGLSIFSQMITSPATIIVQVDGVAASMAAVLLAAADKVVILDYARVMIHSPYYVDENNEMVSKLSDSNKKALQTLKTMLIMMLSKRGILPTDAGKMMTTADNWFTAQEAVDAKLADEIVTTGKIVEMASLDLKSLVARVKQETIINPKTFDMNKLIAKFQLPEASTEDAVLGAIDKLETNHTTALNKLKDDNKKLVDKLISVAKLSGNVTEENEAGFRKLAETDPELFTQMVNVKKEDLTAGQTRVSDFIDKLAGLVGDGSGKAKDAHNWDWYQKNDPAALNSMRNSDPTKYNKLKAEYESSFENK
jgi:ATP-dependent protease ClpP protease subunit